MCCSRHLGPHGACYRQIHIQQDCFLANEVLVLAGATLEPQSILGNKSVAMPLTSYNSGVWTGTLSLHTVFHTVLHSS